MKANIEVIVIAVITILIIYTVKMELSRHFHPKKLQVFNPIFLRVAIFVSVFLQFRLLLVIAVITHTHYLQ